jgi:dUTP pyrophosphatase
MDLMSTVDVVLPAGGGRSVVPTGIAVAIPPGHGGFVLPRSGLAANHGVTVLNGPGLIDSGYRGEVRVPLVNTDPTLPARIRRGDRIAQLVVLPVPRIEWDVVDELPDSASDDRGAKGFGSSGR